MKHLFLLVSLTASVNTFAYICLPPMILEPFVRSDFVARIRIGKNLPNKDLSTYFYESKVTIQKLYKGKAVNAIWIEGSSDGARRTSCDLFFKEETEMIVYANENGDGRYIFGSCSGYHVLDKNKARTIAMLDFLLGQKLAVPIKTCTGQRWMSRKIRETHW